VQQFFELDWTNKKDAGNRKMQVLDGSLLQHKHRT